MAQAMPCERHLSTACMPNGAAAMGRTRCERAALLQAHCRYSEQPRSRVGARPSVSDTVSRVAWVTGQQRLRVCHVFRDFGASEQGDVGTDVAPAAARCCTRSYIDVGESNSKHIFYYVVHSEGSVRDDPVMLWLTGGPGCSAMDAYTYENGPFTFNFSGARAKFALGAFASWT
eukprot:363378-Chlamydomonas_euryale.AAC.13